MSPVPDSPEPGPADNLRSAERAFLDTGEVRWLRQGLALLEGVLRDAPFATAVRARLSLLWYDRTGDERLLAAAGEGLGVELRRWAVDGDRTHLDQAIALGSTTPDASSTGWRTADLAYAHLERYRLTGAPGELDAATAVLRAALPTVREPPVRAQHLRHLAACEQEHYLRNGTRSRLDRAITGYERALALVPARSVLRPLILTELGTALQDRFGDDEAAADLDRAVALGEEAVATQPGGPDAPTHLVNLGTARHTRFERTSDPDDLDRAVWCWTEALHALPPASAYRAAFHDRLAIGHLTRWHYGDSSESDLVAAVHHGRAALKLGAAEPNAAMYAGHLSDALIERWELQRNLDDLHEAVRVYTDAAATLDPSGVLAPDLLANLAHTLLSRYQEIGDLADVDAALSALARLTKTRLSPGRRASVASSTARALLMRYQTTGDRRELSSAITAARQALTGIDPAVVTWNSSVARLATLLFLRYRREGRRQDLDTAIRMLTDVTERAVDGAGQDATPLQRNRLAAFLTERHERYGNPADRQAALALVRQATGSDSDTQEPTLGAGLASALHHGFTIEGQFDELDEAIARHRSAIDRTLPAAPALAPQLSNLGLALQDYAIYHDDDAALNEAISLHQQAADAAGPDSPERAGYLSTLAAALQVRFETTEQTADLRRAIDLYQLARRTLPPRAPEHADILSGLASATHLYARATADGVDVERAIRTYRAALRRTRATSPARPHVLRGYAEALAEQGAPESAVHPVFQGAMTASAGAPVARLEVAMAWGAWALRTGRWKHAAEAYRTARETRRTLFGIQNRRTHRDSWLTRTADIATGEAYARVRCGQPREAAIALDNSRAISLSEQLDARTLVDRLRAAGQGHLANQYRDCIDRMLRLSTLRHRGPSSAPPK